MKKILCVVIATMLCMPLGVFADATGAQAMQEALVCVKNKIEVPHELSEFSPYSYENGGKTSYTFMWQNKESDTSMEIASDSEGRITNYYFHDSKLKSDKMLTKLSKSDILTFAEEFIKEALPEVYEGASTLVFREKSWSVNGVNYNLEFVRTYNGIEVKDNAVSVRITVYDDVPCVRSMYANINYDAAFENEGETVADYEKKYREVFPEEVIYKDVYSSEKKDATVLVYRFKDSETGFILASTGEVATEDPRETGGDEVFDTADKNMAMGSGGAREEVLTEKELAELSKVKNLISADGAFKLLDNLPHVKIDSSLKKESYNISQRNDKYIVSVSYASKDKDYRLSASFDGESGDVLSLYAGKYSAAARTFEMTPAKKKTADKNTDEFLKAALGDKLYGFELVRSDETKTNVSYDYDRVVNSIRYISDGIYVSYNAQDGMIASYSLDFDDMRSFDAPDGIIDADTAFSRLMEISPLKKIYMKTGGSYKVCFTVSEYGKEIDAFTGSEYNEYAWQKAEEYAYTDIENHWAGEKIAKLAEVQIGLAGDEFCPNDGIMQSDALRLFASGTRGRYYLDYSDADLYSELIREGILTEEEKNPEKLVTREEAFIYMIRLAGLGDVAKLSDIFKVEYEDGHLLSEGNIGYPAILTGMGVICGNGGKLRPNDTMTRAEAAVMVYNYMVK